MLQKLKNWFPWLFYEPKQCETCKQVKSRVEKRKFPVPPQMREMMTSQSEMCDDCYTNLAKVVYDIKV